MAQGRDLMADWVVQALRESGGRATIKEIAKWVWDTHEGAIREEGDLVYEWQYELRWAGDILRKSGVLKPAADVERGVWESA